MYKICIGTMRQWSGHLNAIQNSLLMSKTEGAADQNSDSDPFGVRERTY